jgi:L-rhamnose-H+ transport protein
MYLGLLLSVAAGILSGCCVLPMKFAQRWKWENVWVLANGIALVVIPAIIVSVTLPVSMRELYLSADRGALTASLLLGTGWGIGATLCGMAYTMLGMGLGMSVVLGLSSVVGSVLPIVFVFSGAMSRSSVIGVLAGLCIMLAGLILSARAGAVRQSAHTEQELTRTADLKAFARGDVRIGLPLGILSGLLSSMFNLALVFGNGIRTTALARGASPFAAASALSFPLTVSGFLAIFVYCSYLLIRNRTYRLFFAPGTASHWVLILIMSALYIGSIVVYAFGLSMIGAAGAVIGFPIYMATMILTGNAAGLLTGEWKNAPRRAYSFGIGGMVALVAAIVVIAFSRPPSVP